MQFAGDVAALFEIVDERAGGVAADVLVLAQLGGHHAIALPMLLAAHQVHQ